MRTRLDRALLQVEVGERPCLDAVWEEQQVVTSDLGSEPRWPTWGPKMVQKMGAWEQKRRLLD